MSDKETRQVDFSEFDGFSSLAQNSRLAEASDPEEALAAFNENMLAIEAYLGITSANTNDLHSEGNN